MGILRRALLAFALAAGLAPAFAQVPPPVPAMPDLERRTSYSISGSTCACSVGFALYGDSTDYSAWLEVFVNGVLVPSFNYTITSPTGPLASIARPITDAVLTFNAVQTGTVQIVGARRPRRSVLFVENRGVAARDLNQGFNDIYAMLREDWDKLNDVTGRGIFGLPGETMALLPSAASRAGGYLCFDGTGMIPLACAPLNGQGNVVGPNSSVDGHFAVFSGTTGRIIRDGGTINAFLLPPQGRLTLATHTPVMTASQTTQGNLFYDTYGGSGVPYFNGTTDIMDAIPSNEVFTAMQSTGAGVLGAGDVYDVWWEGNTHHNICVATNGGGSGWTGDTGGSQTARGTGYTQLDFTTRPYTTNANAISHCYNGSTDYGSVVANKLTYLGTICTDSSSAGKVSFTYGTVSANGGAARFCVWNNYNRQPLKTLVADNTASWTYAPGVANTYREAHGSTTFNVTQVFGVSQDPVVASYAGIATPPATSPVTAAIPGIGIDSTTVFCDTTGYIASTTTVAITAQSTARCKTIPGVGIHAVNALESNTTTNSTTWFGWLAANYGVGLIYEGLY